MVSESAISSSRIAQIAQMHVMPRLNPQNQALMLKTSFFTPQERWLHDAHKFIVSPQHIVESAQPFGDHVTDEHGVYFIVHDRRIQYVGMSDNLAFRLGGHWNRWRFDACFVLTGMSEHFKGDLEEFYIAWLQPQANSRAWQTSMTQHLAKAKRGDYGDPTGWVLSTGDVYTISEPLGPVTLKSRIPCRILQ